MLIALLLGAVSLCGASSWAALIVNAPTPMPPVALPVVWRTQLNNASSFNASDACRVGRSAMAGANNSLYLTTDIAGCLYAINVTTGKVAWTYAAWPALPNDVQQQRFVTGSSAAIVVLRATVLYCLNATSGLLMWSRTLKSESEASWMWVDDVQILMVGSDSFSVWRVIDGSPVYAFDHLWTPEYGALAVATTRIAALRRVWTSSTAFNASVVLLDRATGVTIHEIQLDPANLGDRQPQLFQLTETYLLVYMARAVSRFQVPSGELTWQAILPDGFQPTSYGLGAPYFFLRTAGTLVSFDLGTGARYASIDLYNIGPFPQALQPFNSTGRLRFSKINHLWGMNGFASLGLLFKQQQQDGTTSATESEEGIMCVGGLDASTMQWRYFTCPPSVPTMNDYGNSMAIGDIVIPAAAGFTLIEPSGAIIDATTAFPAAVPASLQVGSTSITLTFGNSVASLALPSPNATAPRRAFS